jgi:hypothetical protein
VEIKKGKWYKCVKNRRVLTLTEAYLFLEGEIYRSFKEGSLRDHFGSTMDWKPTEETFKEYFKPYRKNKRWRRGRKT